MQVGGRKVEATGSTRFHITFWKKSVRIAPPTTLTDSYTRFLPNAQPYRNFWLGHPNPNHIISHYRSVPFNTLVVSVRYLFTLLKYTLFYYIVEQYPTFLHCCAIPNPNTFLRYTLYCFIAEQFPFSIHCWAITNLQTLLRYTQLYHIAEVNR